MQNLHGQIVLGIHLLAASSTQQQIRSHFLKLIMPSEAISHGVIQLSAITLANDRNRLESQYQSLCWRQRSKSMRTNDIQIRIEFGKD